MTMTARVDYELKDSIATITMDDGKLNVLSLDMFAQLGAAFDRAQQDRAVVVLTGREGAFSAGFDLRTLRAGGAEARRLVLTGFELAERILAFPAPVVIACPGHAIAMGAFLLLAGDYRIAALGDYKIGANEVSLGVTMPFFALEICRQRLVPTHFHRAAVLSEMYAPHDAVTAGFLDRAVPASELPSTTRSVAAQLAKLDGAAHTASKLRARDLALRAIRSAIEADAAAVPDVK
jgi:enoyl-CoA hydratase